MINTARAREIARTNCHKVGKLADGLPETDQFIEIAEALRLLVSSTLLLCDVLEEQDKV